MMFKQTSAGAPNKNRWKKSKIQLAASVGKLSVGKLS
jgi:hypothetical protein